MNKYTKYIQVLNDAVNTLEINCGGHFWPLGDHSSLNLVLSQLHHWAAQTCHGVRPVFTCTTRLRKDLLSHVLNPKTIPEMVSSCKQTVEVGEVVLLQPMQFS